jgi:hypothetical protein
MRTKLHRTSAHRLALATAIAGVLAAAQIVTPSARAQEGPYEPWVGERGVTETVAGIMAREPSAPPIDPASVVVHRHRRMDRTLPQNPSSPAVAQWPPASQGMHAGEPSQPPAAQPNFTVGTSFLGVQSSESIYVPPDTQGAVGPTQVLFIANGRIKVFDRQGNLGGLNTTTDNFFQTVRNNSPAVDPQAKYDRTSGRFIVTSINETVPNRVLIAVSSSSTITSQSSFTFYFFQQDLVMPTGNAGQFADYDKVGVDANAVYVGADMFSGNNFVATTCWVVKKSSILSGGPLAATAFRNIVANSSAAGPRSPMGVDNDDPASTEGYVVGVDNSQFGRLAIRRISNPGGTPSISANLFVTVPATGLPIPQVALGSSGPLDTIDDRLFYVQLHRDRFAGVTSLWAAHNIEVNTSGVYQSGGGRNGSRWYQLGSLTSTPVLLQSGTLFDSASSGPRGFTIPSCAMSGQGHMVMGATYASTTDHAGCAISGRYASDAPGSIQAPTLAVVSTTAYNAQGGLQRWGDFSKVDVDPIDDQTLWAFVEYCNAANSWGVRVIQVMAPPPAAPTSASPSTLAQGASNVSVVVTGTSSSGSGFYDTDPAFNRLVATVDGTGVTVNTIAWNSPTQITLDVSVAANAPSGSRTITVTNPDGQTITSASGIVTVTQNGALGSPYCFGDGSLATPCPCANSGVSGHGCANSADANGAALVATGTTTPDTAVLHASEELGSALTIFLQGDVNASAGIVFGDGVRCANGTLLRLYTTNAVGGSVSAPHGADPSITARSAALGDTIAPGTSRYYHAYYRDPNLAFCPAGFNATNAMQIDW